MNSCVLGVVRFCFYFGRIFVILFIGNLSSATMGSFISFSLISMPFISFPCLWHQVERPAPRGIEERTKVLACSSSLGKSFSPLPLSSVSAVGFLFCFRSCSESGEEILLSSCF